MKSVSLFLLLFLPAFFVLAEQASAATYYVCDSATACNAASNGWVTGNDANACSAKGTACKTIGGAFKKMAGGDTLVIGDGVYSGAGNSVTKNNYPPFGNASAWTIIKAEHDGGVVFDNASFSFDTGSGNYPFYWQLEGLTWANGYFYVSYGHHVKVLRSGGYNAGSGNNVNFTAGRGSSYVLFEDSYAWGEGRYKFMGYQASNIIIRRCVGRLDKEDAQGEPIGIFAMYSVSNGKIQNSIGIDSDVPNYWTNVYNRIGCFGVPVTQMNASNITVENSICLNSELGGAYYEGGGYTSSNMITRNNVFWDVNTLSSYPVNLSRSIQPSWINNTFGLSTTSEEYLSGYGSSNMQITNNLFYSIGGGGVARNWGTHDYNAFYNSTGLPTLASHEITNLNPIWNASTNPTGSLKYITRIESGSNLSGKGSSGGNIGATIMKMVGAQGTLWGETGYDAEQSTNMWPFPNEKLIKSKMAAYTYPGINGARGFAASGTGLYGGPITLTSYIWEYLGNPCPTDICSQSNTTTLSAPTDLTIIK